VGSERRIESETKPTTLSKSRRKKYSARELWTAESTCGKSDDRRAVGRGEDVVRRQIAMDQVTNTASR